MDTNLDIQVEEALKAYFASLHDIEEIEVLGFSFSAVDMPYIQALYSYNDHPDQLRWRASVYRPADRPNTIAALTSIGVAPHQITTFTLGQPDSESSIAD